MSSPDLLKLIDEMHMSAPDRAAAKARLAQAERLVDWVFAIAGGLRRSVGAFALTPIRRRMAKVRRSPRPLGLTR